MSAQKPKDDPSYGSSFMVNGETNVAYPYSDILLSSEEEAITFAHVKLERILGAFYSVQKTISIGHIHCDPIYSLKTEKNTEMETRLVVARV